MGDFGIVLHSFMDYFDYSTILICARIVDVLDQINNHGRPMEEYSFWPDVLDGLKEMYTRTQFAVDQGGYFPKIKVSDFSQVDSLKVSGSFSNPILYNCTLGKIYLESCSNSIMAIKRNRFID